MKIKLTLSRINTEAYLNAIGLTIAAGILWALGLAALVMILAPYPVYAGFAAFIYSLILITLTLVLILVMSRVSDFARDIAEIKLNTRFIEEHTQTILTEVRK